MDKFQQSIQAHRFEVDNLFRAYQLNGLSDIEKTQAGHEKYGDDFIFKLLTIIVPKDDIQHYETTLTARLPTPEIAGLSMPTYVTDADGTTTQASAGKGWGFWEKFLGAAESTGATVGSILNDIKNPGSTQSAEQQAEVLRAQQAEAQNTKTMYILGGIFLGAIILIFAFKK